jgi:hypothetical protein
MARPRRAFHAESDGGLTTDALLTVEMVMARYHLRDRRAARRLMDDAGGFRIGAHLYVRLEDLRAFEDARKVARRSTAGTERSPAPPAQTRTSPQPLAPGWWREGDRSSGAER